ncbi:PDZ domain-containing protein [Candidatus Venteria ishoeyi]|uniref:M61 family metallopeptidase n=1 Tax=Candidatus Venteria ishoeyi TaxID=1899563 RepID=UPI0025A55D0D|nr:PDZ domain-containing protein [Candidatus Venteria ishoeyi]MDM8545721.1 PDZ domain-containing protein [Candidatus Venteria ishoeyi]
MNIEKIHYRIEAQSLNAHLFHITCTVLRPAATGQKFSLPAWLPGSYMIRNFAQHVIEFSAESEGCPVAVSRTDKNTWFCAPCEGVLKVYYTVYAHELCVRGAWLDKQRAFFNASCVFMQVAGQADEACAVTLVAPDDPECGNWRVATSLSRHSQTNNSAPLYGFGDYRADNYAELIDHPVEMSAFTLVSFEVAGVPHDLVISGRQRANLQRLQRDIQTVCEGHVALFGELPEMERYVFLVLAVDDAYGGLEHRNSCALICKHGDLMPDDHAAPDKDYQRFLGLCSHEYFHLWHVKRIKPTAFIQPDLSKEVYTRQLWVFEGITAYYDDLNLLRTGLISLKDYLGLLAQTITRHYQMPGRTHQSLADSSFEAWTKLYLKSENTPNATISYYLKGALLAFALDMRLRRDTQGKVSLDTLMQASWKSYGKTGEGVPEEGFEKLAATLSGIKLEDFFQTYLYGKKELPLADLFADLAIQCQFRPAHSLNDKGGLLTEDTVSKQASPYASLGIRLKPNKKQVVIATVFTGEAAQQAGLAAGDHIIALDAWKVNALNLDKRLKSYQPGDVLSVHFFRRNELLHVQLTLQAPSADICLLTLETAATAACLSRLNTWREKLITA